MYNYLVYRVGIRILLDEIYIYFADKFLVLC
jgi:hypothetical protein